MRRLPLHERIYRALLRLFPREFRGDLGDQMIEDFRDQRDDAAGRSVAAVLRLWTRTVVDILHRAPREHFDILRRDTGFALRLFRRRPGLTASAVLTLAVGIGLSAAIFSVAYGVLWRSLPLPESERLVVLSEVSPPPGREPTRVSPDNFRDWQKESRTLDALAAISRARATLIQQGGAEEVQGAAVSVDFFRAVPARAILGRLLNEGDYAPLLAQLAARDPKAPRRVLVPPAAVIAYSLWQRQFGGRSDIIGQKVSFGRVGHVEIVGVLQRNFVFPLTPEAECWFPEVPEPGQRRARYLTAIGRLAPGRTALEAQAEFDVIASRLAAAYPEANKDRGASVTLLREYVTAGVQTQLWFLVGTVLCVLLIVCANVAHLLLTHMSGRQRELATRVALGASRAHLVRQGLTEGLVLASAGGLAGFLLARWTVPYLVGLAPESIPRLDEVTVGAQVFLFAIVVAVAAGLVCGLVAVIGAGRLGLDTPLRTTGASAKAPGGRFRQGLIVSEIALALILAAGVGRRPLTPGGAGTVFTKTANPSEEIDIKVDAVGPGYLEALDARLVAGRFFTEQDGPNAPPVALVNEAAAKRYWPHGAIGQRILHADEQTAIVGLLSDIRRTGLEVEPEPTLYLPSVQTAMFWTNNVLVRTSGDPRELLPAIRTVTSQIDPELPLTRIQTLGERLAEVLAPRRFTLWLVSLFSLIALGLAVVGIYGVVMESVTQRVPEIGVRMALGATAGAVMGTILRQGSWIIVIGVALGTTIALALNEVMSAFVFRVTTTDPLSYAAAAAGLAVAGLAASALPARRASRVDPVIALRHE